MPHLTCVLHYPEQTIAIPFVLILIGRETQGEGHFTHPTPTLHTQQSWVDWSCRTEVLNSKYNVKTKIHHHERSYYRMFVFVNSDIFCWYRR